ncbi:universal stress protein [Actinoplanes sp. NPDC051861]|uniref:universal stress protein n=1 Tax=Actinoplanes sp. NPDC051861 TaxID=3155170 RepID=UPI00343FA0D0
MGAYLAAGIDGSRTHPATVDLATDEAVRRGVPLLLLHCWPGRYRRRAPMPAESDARRLLESAALRARSRAPGLPVSTELLTGDPVALLAGRTERAELLVIGHRDEGPGRPGWGTTAARLARDCRCPLLVRRGGADRRGPVVVAVSGQDGSAETVRQAFDEARLTGSRLVAVHVWAPGNEDRRAAQRRLTETVAACARLCPEVPVEPLVVPELEFAYTLDRASRRGRLLVAGTGRRGRLSLLLARAGLPPARTAQSPILLVPALAAISGR